MTKTMRACALTVGLAVSALTGCGKGLDTGATAKIAFKNVTVSNLFMLSSPTGRAGTDSVGAMLATYTPTTFKMKLIAAYVTEDINATTGNNVGNTSMVYLNPDCADDIMHCDISGGTAEDGAAMSHIVTSYFDFSGDSSTVNAALNAQGRSVTPGTYRYARLEFCKYNSGNANNITWGMTSPSVSDRQFKRNSCTVNSALISPAITVAAGDTLTINLSYSLVNAVSDTASGDDCTGGSPSYCFTLPTFTPSASN